MNVRVLAASFLAGLACLAGAPVTAQDSRPIRFVVPFAAGGATDALARTLATKLGPELGQSVIVENKPGASGQIGTVLVKSAPPDGLTYLFTTDHTVVTLPHLVEKVGFEPLKDFVAVGQVARFQLALAAAPSTKSKTLAEFVRYIKANPDKASYGVPVVGGFPSTVGTVLGRAIGVPMVAVPYAGSGPAVMNVAADQVTSSITGLGDALPMARADKVRLLAITGAQRSKIFPGVPTFEELGYPGLANPSWYAFFAPAGVPAAAAERFNRALGKVLADAEVKTRLTELSLELAPTTLAEASREFKTSADFWTEAAKSPDFVRP